MSALQIAAAVVAVLFAAGAVWQRGKLSGERKLLAAGLVLVLGIYASGVLSALPDPKAIIEDIAQALGAWTYALVGVLAFLETGAFVGLVAPGETVVIAGGVIAGQGEIELVPLIGLVWICAVLGDTTSFFLGRRLGTPLPRAPRPPGQDHARAAVLGRGLLRSPRRQDHPDRPLHRPGARARALHRRHVRDALPALHPVQHRRDRAVGHRLLRARLHLLALIRPGRPPRRAGDLRLWSHGRGDRGDRGRLQAPS